MTPPNVACWVWIGGKILKDENRKAMFAKQGKGSGMDPNVLGIKFTKKVSMSDNKELLEQKMQRIPKQSVKEYFNFKELDEAGKEKAREWFRQTINEGGENWYAEDEGILYDTKEQKGGEELGLKNVIPKYWDLDREHFIQFGDLTVVDDKKFRTYLKMNGSLDDKVDIDLVNHHDQSSTIGFSDNYGSDIDVDEEFDKEDFKDHDKEDRITKSEYGILQKAKEKFDSLIEMSYNHLKNNFEYQFTNEAVDENIDANDYEFDKDGDRVVV